MFPWRPFGWGCIWRSAFPGGSRPPSGRRCLPGSGRRCQRAWPPRPGGVRRPGWRWGSAGFVGSWGLLDVIGKMRGLRMGVMWGGYFYLNNICYYNGLQADCQSFFAILHIKRPQVNFSTWDQRFQLMSNCIPMSSAIRVIKSFIVGAALLSNSIFRISGSSSFAIAIRSGLVLMICTFGFMRNWI